MYKFALQRDQHQHTTLRIATGRDLNYVGGNLVVVQCGRIQTTHTHGMQNSMVWVS
jgi:hypothetical protein